MGIRISSSSVGSLEGYAKKVQTKLKNTADYRSSAGKTVNKLKSETPVKSGKTVASWDSGVVRTSSGVDINITNSNVTRDGVPVVVLLKNGHGTGTGGYVPANDFITPIANEMVKEVSSSIERNLR